MYYLINSEQQEILGFTSAYAATGALVDEINRQKANHRETTESDLWYDSVAGDWRQITSRALGLRERAEDGAYRLAQPAFFWLPNQQMIVLAEFATIMLGAAQ